MSRVDNGEIHVKLTQMRDSAQKINQSASRIRDCLDAIDNEVRTLGADRFMSVGAEAFRAEYHRLTPKMRDTFDQLMRFQEKLVASADDIEMAGRTTKG